MTAELITPVKLHKNIFRGCRRCGGTLRLERDLDSLVDHDAYDYVCLQCGRVTPLEAMIAAMQQARLARDL